MSQFLPPNLLALFVAREMPHYMPPLDKLTHEKKRQGYTGLADFMKFFEDPEETPPPTKSETKQERLDRKRREKAEQNLYKIEQDLALWDPKNNANAVTDPFRTLFVARINYDTSESKLKREFEVYGKVRQIKLVYDKITGKPRGYGFVEYENESDMHAAYKRADGKKIDGKRVIVDIERGRTIKGWKPRRLGGGKGGRKSHFDPLASTTTTTTAASSSVPDRHALQSIPVENVATTRDSDSKRRDRGGEKDKERKRDRSRERRSRSKSRERKKRSKSRDRHRSRSKERSKKARRSKDRSKERKHRSSRSPRGEKTSHKLKEEHGNGSFNHSSNGNGAMKLEPGEYVD